MKIAVIANGILEDHEFHKHTIQKHNLIICADGGANHAQKLGITPNYIIGDMDSVKPEVLEEFKQSKIIRDSNQDTTDVELAIQLAESLNATEINLFCATGNRLDHTIANIICLTKNPLIKIINNKNEMHVINKETEVTGEKGSNVSIIPLTNVQGLSYEGLKWQLNNKNVSMGWLGICNQITNSPAKIKLTNGQVLVIQSRD